jgi:DNA-3-methyladenine glycosylase II
MAIQIHHFSPDNFRDICDALAASDTDLTAIINAHGYPPMWNRPNTFETLVHIILEQQVSLASALAALNKLRERLGQITPEGLLRLTDEELKACYFSRQKTTYARHLAQALQSGELDLQALEKLPDHEVRARLTTLKGIGDWTVDVYLIFVLQRADIFPLGDLAAVNALKRLKKIPKDTSREQLVTMIGTWQPHRTIATMLLWHYYLSAPRPVPDPSSRPSPGPAPRRAPRAKP